MRGRKPVPTALKLLRGNPGKRSLPKDEPKPEAPAVLEAPPHLEGRSRELWDRVTPRLLRLGLATELDSLVLELLFRAYEDFERSREFIRTNGETYETFGPTGSMVRQHPAVAMRNDAWRRTVAAAAEFGMTPSSRSRVSGAGGTPVDPFEEFLAGRA